MWERFTKNKVPLIYQKVSLNNLIFEIIDFLEKLEKKAKI
jgi:hypothetical protein